MGNKDIKDSKRIIKDQQVKEKKKLDWLKDYRNKSWMDYWSYSWVETAIKVSVLIT